MMHTVSLLEFTAYLSFACAKGTPCFIFEKRRLNSKIEVASNLDIIGLFGKSGIIKGKLKALATCSLTWEVLFTRSHSKVQILAS